MKKLINLHFCIILSKSLLLLVLEEFGGLSTEGIKLSFEKLDSLILESLQIIEDKLKLENTFNKNQSTNNN